MSDPAGTELFCWICPQTTIQCVWNDNLPCLKWQYGPELHGEGALTQTLHYWQEAFVSLTSTVKWLQIPLNS